MIPALLVYPVLITLFVAALSTLYARNLIGTAPFLAILAAYGWFFIYDRFLGRRAYQMFWSGLVILLLAINAWWMVTAANSIHNRKTEDYTAELSRYLDSRPKTNFVLSSAVRKELVARGLGRHSNVFDRSGEPEDLAVFRAFELAFDRKSREAIVTSATTTVSEAATHAFARNEESRDDWRSWSANHFNYTVAWFGPYEVNFNYYPSWVGNDRIVVMPVRSALSLGVLVGE